MVSKQDSPRRQPTLETVAAVAGVSRATVSRVINDSAQVSPAVRQAVEEAIERLGFVPNRAARSLVTRRTDSIAVVVREPVAFGVADPHLSRMIVAASQSLARTGLQLAVMMAGNADDHAQIARYVRAGHVDGVMLLSVHDDDPLPHQLVRANVPLVIGGRLTNAIESVGFVDADNLAGARAAAQRMVSTGRTRLATIGGPQDMAVTVDRVDGFRAAVRDAGLPAPTVVYGAFTRESGEAATREVLRRDPDVQGIFAASDLMAIGAMRVLRESGRSVPNDVAVIGFDNIELGRHTEPPLTTVDQPAAEMARAMVEMMLTLIAGNPVPPPQVLPTSLVVRGSG